MEQANAKDLIVLTADPQMQGTIATLLTERRRSLGISDLTFDVRAHPDRDSGCRTASASALSPLRRDYRKAMVIFDFHGSGAHSITAPELESQLERQLETAGWSLDDVAVVVIEPELEAWIFGPSWRRRSMVSVRAGEGVAGAPGISSAGCPQTIRPESSL